MTIAMLLLAAAAAPAVPAAVQIVTEDHHHVLRSAQGARPLYTFDKDEPGKSNCHDRCATAWPPLAAPAAAKATGHWTVVARPDGTGQWAWDGKPVYTFARDTDSKATGDGMGGVWHLVPTLPAH